jgi:hypothetical protein
MNATLKIALLRAKCVARSCFQRAASYLIAAGLGAIEAHRRVLALLREFRAA